MATDALVRSGGRLAELSTATTQQLDAFLPPTWSHGNPVDIIGDASAQRYADALTRLIEAPEADAVLFMHVPTAVVPALEVARACAPIARTGRVFSCWVGGSGLDAARQVFEDAGVPSYATPEQAVAGFMQTVNYRRNQDALMHTPPSLPQAFSPDTGAARAVIRAVLAQGRSMLSEPEAKQVLAAYGIPVVRTAVAHDADEAVRLAEEMGFPVALKIISPQITHKTEVGGVALSLASCAEVRNAAEALARRLRERAPGAALEGFSVQEMVRRPGAYETIVGATVDSVFGPVILFGQGGVAVEVIGDRAVALPPLNQFLVADMIRGTRVAQLLGEFRRMPPVDMPALEEVLLRVSELVCEVPALAELDINPLIADESGAVAVDARVVLRPPAPQRDRYAHMAIHPYPAHLVSAWQPAQGPRVTLRPIRPEDAEMEKAFVRRLSPESRYFRFMDTLRELTPLMLVRFTQIDYDREMAFVATVAGAAGEEEIGVVRYVTNPDGESCEFAIVIADDWQRKGLGRRLMTQLIDVARARGLRSMMGHVLAENRGMLALCQGLGFVISDSPEGPMLKRATLALA
jgi:acetyltransferase